MACAKNDPAVEGGQLEGERGTRSGPQRLVSLALVLRLVRDRLPEPTGEALEMLDAHARS